MANDVKSLLDSIIDNTNNSFQNKGVSVGTDDRVSIQHPTTFDSGKFREKLSLYVLKDIISAMMHDETTDLDAVIDRSIQNHIGNDYNGTCYGYLCNARDRLKSPLLGDIIQEIDDKTEEVAGALEATKDADLINGQIDTKELLKNVTDYDTFRDKLKEQVSKKVVDDVSGVVSQRNDAPVFDDLDDKLIEIDKDDANEDVTSESVILRMCSSIVTEYAINKTPISTEDGLNMAIVEYCVAEMDYLFKADPQVSIYSKYDV